MTHKTSKNKRKASPIRLMPRNIYQEQKAAAIVDPEERYEALKKIRLTTDQRMTKEEIKKLRNMINSDIIFMS
nr:MV07 [Cafeteriavirus-dependent mavirus]